MRDKNRDAIRLVLQPSMYKSMLVLSDNTCLCPNCTRKKVRVILSNLKTGYEFRLGAVCLAEVDGTLYCEVCEQPFSEYEN